MNEQEAGVLVEALWSAVSRGGKSLDQIPTMVRRLLETGAWKKRTIRTGKVVEHSSFYSFLTSPPLSGCGYDPAKIVKLISGDVETLTLWREAMKAKRGRKVKDIVDNVNDIKRTDGNSRIYTLSRLKAQRPDLFAKIKVGEISANSAAIEAGFRKIRTPLMLLRSFWKKATQAERDQFLSEVACP